MANCEGRMVRSPTVTLTRRKGLVELRVDDLKRPEFWLVIQVSVDELLDVLRAGEGETVGPRDATDA